MLWISSDRDDQRIFLGGKILASIFLGGEGGYSKLMFHVMLSGNFFGLEIRRGILEG